MTTRCGPRRLFLDMEAGLPPTASLNTTIIGSDPSEPSFDNNMVIVLAALLCALICALSLSSIVRCALRCAYRVGLVPPGAEGRHATPTAAAHFAASAASAAGLKKSALSQIPTMPYGSGVNITVTDCPICLGEFVEGQRLRVLPKCSHGFHVRCIDTWLLAHSSCPLCRQQALLDNPTSCLGEEINLRVQLPVNGPSSGQPAFVVTLNEVT